MKKILSLLLTLVLVLGLAACSRNTDTAQDNVVNVESDPTANLSNPWVDHDSLDAACEDAKIDLKAPEMFFSDDEIVYRSMDQDIIEVQYTGADGETFTIRKGATEADISGDYTVYDYAGDVTVNDITVTVKGMSESELFAASWVQDGHFYYVVSTIVIPSDAMLSTISELITMNAQ